MTKLFVLFEGEWLEVMRLPCYKFCLGMGRYEEYDLEDFEHKFEEYI